MKQKNNTTAIDPPKLFGLVLSGGTSTRMGRDKGLVNYHGVPQREYVYHLLMRFCDDVFLSVRQDQQSSVPNGFKTIVDQNNFNGPFNGILSAHNGYKDKAWLVLACDLPLMDPEALRELMEQRSPDKYATAFANHKTGQPEPLACIWEPTGLTQAVEYLKNSNCPSPKRFLMDADIALVQPQNGQVLFNANTVADYEFVQNALNG
nr:MULTISPECIES: NTP transferase domain-containing protein [unclassified Allomuricauda]